MREHTFRPERNMRLSGRGIPEDMGYCPVRWMPLDIIPGLSQTGVPDAIFLGDGCSPPVMIRSVS